MHMAFKYLLELLRAGLYEEFFTDLKTGLPAFLDPVVYGRSPLENSSFIVSSAHPDPALHGNGFVTRLSGSTAEFLSIWLRMTAGPQPFRLRGDALVLEVRPALPGWLFREDGTFSFRFLGACDVTYHNPAKGDTFRRTPKRFKLQPCLCEPVILEGDAIPSPYAGMVRDGQIQSIDVFLYGGDRPTGRHSLILFSNGSTLRRFCGFLIWVALHLSLVVPPIPYPPFPEG
jgi:hypothetical protein